MRNVLLVTGLAMALFASAAQAAKCPEVIEVPLVAPMENSESVQAAIDCLTSRIELMQGFNAELLAAAHDAVAPAVYVLRFSHDLYVVSLDKVGEGEVDYDLEHFDDPSQRTEVIKHDSPFYVMATAAYNDLVSQKDGKRPASVANLVSQVTSAPSAIIAARWPMPTKMDDSMTIKAEGK